MLVVISRHHRQVGRSRQLGACVLHVTVATRISSRTLYFLLFSLILDRSVFRANVVVLFYVGVAHDQLLRRMRHFTMCTLGEESLELTYATIQQRLAVRKLLCLKYPDCDPVVRCAHHVQ